MQHVLILTLGGYYIAFPRSNGVAHLHHSSLHEQSTPALPSLFPRRGFFSSEVFFFLCSSTSLATHAMGRHITIARNMRAVLAHGFSKFLM